MKMFPIRHRPGVLFLDVLIGTAVFAIVVSGVIYAMLFSQQGMLKSGDRIRGVSLARQGLVATRTIRDADFDTLEEGTFGVQLGESGTWELTETPSTTADGYTTSIVIESLSDDRYKVTATTEWDLGIEGNGSVSVSTEMSDWHRTLEVGNWASVSLDGAYVDDGTPLFNAAVIGESYAFVTSETSDGGAGLYVFDISSTSSPVRTASAFDLGVAGYQMALIEPYLFVATGDASQEIRIYDVSSPATLSSSNLVSSINVPGDANVRAITYYNGVLYVGAKEDAGESEMFTYDVADVESIGVLDELNDPGSSFLDLQLLNGYAYLASSLDTSELRVVDVYDPVDLVLATGEGYNVTDTPDATSVVAAGDYVVLGRLQGDISEEFHLFDVSESPVPPSAPYNAEAGEDVNALAADPTGAYVFAATNHDSQEFVVLDIDTFASGGNPITEVYDTATGFGRGVTYDIGLDRAFLLTNTAFIILKPA